MGKNSKNKFEVIEAAGGVLWRHLPTGMEVAIIHRSRYDDWTLPKGKCKPGETWTETAVREVFEETSCIARLGDFIGGQVYTVNNMPKVVLYWHMDLIHEQGFTPNEEVDKLLWLPPHKAKKIMTYQVEKEFIIVK